MKRHLPLILLVGVGLLIWLRSRSAPRAPVPGDGAWASVIGGTETVLPNYSGL